MSTSAQSLYDLLPTIHRLRDAENNDELKSYLNVFAEQISILQENVDQLYDDQFIETCAEWVVPYIGDLIGYKPLHNIENNQVSLRLSQRAEVANTIAYRRRKGTALLLEQLARDVTGWPARAVEFFQTLATTQYMNHIRLHNHYAPDLRDWAALRTIDTAFNSVTHTADVRHIDTDKGRYNIKNIGIFLWRLQSYSLSKSPLIPIEPGHYFFSALQHDLPIFNNPVAEENITQIAGPMNVPQPINRRAMDADLGLFYGAGKSVLLYDSVDPVNNTSNPIPDTEIEVCCLANPNGDWINDPDGSTIAVDPETGRISLGPDLIATSPELWADFHYGFSANISGGDYLRGKEFDTKLINIEKINNTESLQVALNNLAGEGIVEITDSGRYVETPSIAVDADSRIEVRATNGHRPLLVLADELLISGGDKSTVTLDGLVIAGGRLRIPQPANGLGELHLRHCTLVPGLTLNGDGLATNAGATSIVVESDNVKVTIDRCITGGIRAVEGAEVVIKDSVVDANQSHLVAFSAPDDLSAGGVLHITNTTVIGKVHTRIMELASNCIFDSELGPADVWISPLLAQRKQEGCVRFSYVPLSARLPRRYRCQPELAINQTIQQREAESETELSSAEKADIASRLSRRIAPVFKSDDYAQPAYCQLALSCAKEILQGADDESEMGVFHNLYQPQREANLKLRLREYLRFGLEAGIFYET